MRDSATRCIFVIVKEDKDNIERDLAEMNNELLCFSQLHSMFQYLSSPEVLQVSCFTLARFCQNSFVIEYSETTIWSLHKLFSFILPWITEALKSRVDEERIKAIEASSEAPFSSTSSYSSSFSSKKPLHSAKCDGCGDAIVGIRYKCVQCDNFDLCELCEEAVAGQHNEEHVFIKIKQPEQQYKNLGKCCLRVESKVDKAEIKASVTKVEETKGGEIKAEDIKAEGIKAVEVNAEETKDEVTKDELTKDEEVTKAEVTKVEESKAEETKDEEIEDEESKAEETKDEDSEEILDLADDDWVYDDLDDVPEETEVNFNEEDEEILDLADDDWVYDDLDDVPEETEVEFKNLPVQPGMYLVDRIHLIQNIVIENMGFAVCTDVIKDLLFEFKDANTVVEHLMELYGLKETICPNIEESSTPNTEENSTSNIEEPSTPNTEENSTSNTEEPSTPNMKENSTSNTEEPSTPNMKENSTSNIK